MITSCYGQHVACFFGFLHSGEIVVPSAAAYDPSARLSVGDVTLDNREAPTMAQITIKASKTDPFRIGVAEFVGRTGNDLCPCLLYTSPSPRDATLSRMPSSA